jgi:hypothetical protein
MADPAPGSAVGDPELPPPSVGTRTVRFQPSSPDRTHPETVVVVLDPRWAPPASPAEDGAVIAVRDVARRVMSRTDAFAVASELLDTWAAAAGIVPTMTVSGVSFWYGARLDHWLWLVDHVIWLEIIDEVLRTHDGIGTLAHDADVDAGLVDALRWVAERDGLAYDAPAPSVDAVAAAAAAVPPTATAAPERPPSPKRPRSFLGRIRWRLRPPEPERRKREIRRRIRSWQKEPPRLLVVQAHARQRIDLPSGPRLMNPYLGPIIDRLRGTRLEPYEVDIRAQLDREADWERLRAAEGRRVLPNDALTLVAPTLKTDDVKATAARIAAVISEDATPLVTHGIDVAPTLRARVARQTHDRLWRRLIDLERIRQLLRRLRPAGILLADEYHRQDWLAAATAERIPVAAAQHGVIYRHHTGYIHRSRPAELRLPDRTYVFGRWERDLLLERSVYRPDEVVVGGSPRLDLVHVEDEGGAETRAQVRAELGVAPEDRLVVLSGTWGPLYRRFHYPIALADIFGGPVERVHVVVKLHPSERDEGDYVAIIERVAEAAGFAPPTVTTVQHIDLYRLLAAADAHLGVHSTLLTEAVFTRTPNLLATGLAGADLLGYVAARVAVPVASPADLSAALERPREEILRDEDREAFLAAHYEPGVASQRIADDLLVWLA